MCIFLSILSGKIFSARCKYILFLREHPLISLSGVVSMKKFTISVITSISLLIPNVLLVTSAHSAAGGKAGPSPKPMEKVVTNPGPEKSNPVSTSSPSGLKDKGPSKKNVIKKAGTGAAAGMVGKKVTSGK
jgi:hypothetical protein